MSGGFNPINVVSQVALGVATGGTSIFAQLATQLVSQIGQQFIQQLGSQLGLPQTAIDVAQGAFAGAAGDYQGASSNFQEAASAFSGALGAGPAEQGDFTRQLEDVINQQASSMAGGEDAREARSSGKGGSWLMAMARALGEKANHLADEMQDLADDMASPSAKPGASLEFGAKSQEFGLFMSSANTAIKSAGEALSQAARKQ